ncbi:ABC transporter substrate-binding protein [Pararhodospirillum photometricum]|nr:extracellular solute-binding protein [Pararhodospirillum photometricum]
MIFQVALASGGAASTLHVLTRDGEPVASPTRRHAASFTTRTGIAVTVEQRPFDDLYDAIMIGFVTNTLRADVLVIPSGWLPDFAPYLSPLPASLRASDTVTGIHPAYRGLMRWEDRWLALGLDGDMMIGVYRRDLFEDPKTQAAFQARHGHPLAPPTTWDEYLEIARFFQGRPGPEGRPLAGTLEAFAPGGQRVWSLFAHAAAFLPEGLFFDPLTLTPALTTPGWHQALEDAKAARAAGPADADHITSHDVRTRFAQGEAAMALDWSDIGVLATDPQTSRIHGSVGFFPLPGSRRVWTSHGWQDLASPRRVPFLGFGGWIAAVPASAADPEAAWAYVAWLGRPEASAADVQEGRSGFNPHRFDQLDPAASWPSRDPADVRALLSLLKEGLDAPEVIHDLRLPGLRAYLAALDRAYHRALEGSASSEDALQEASRTWEALSDRLGRASQRTHLLREMSSSPSGNPPP